MRIWRLLMPLGGVLIAMGLCVPAASASIPPPQGGGGCISTWTSGGAEYAHNYCTSSQHVKGRMTVYISDPPPGFPPLFWKYDSTRYQSTCMTVRAHTTAKLYGTGQWSSPIAYYKSVPTTGWKAC